MDHFVFDVIGIVTTLLSFTVERLKIESCRSVIKIGKV